VKAWLVLAMLLGWQQALVLVVRGQGWMQRMGQLLQQRVLVMTWRGLMMLLSLQIP
jgi:hypothetical protein